MNFTAIDFETAHAKRWSICQVGVVKVVNGQIESIYCKLVKPPGNEYSMHNTNLHGIGPHETEKSLEFPDIWKEIKPFVENQLIVAHNASFDIDCLTQTLEYYGLPLPKFDYKCTYEITGEKLNCACQAYQVELKQHHYAECDALACAEIYLKHINNFRPDYSKIDRTTSKANPFEFSGHERISGNLLKPELDEADPNNPFYGKKVVFTGVLNSIKRLEAAAIVKKKGADIDTAIGKKTHYVIAGSAPGPSKMKKIESYNAKGANIQILNETDFLRMIK